MKYKLWVIKYFEILFIHYYLTNTIMDVSQISWSVINLLCYVH